MQDEFSVLSEEKRAHFSCPAQIQCQLAQRSQISVLSPSTNKYMSHSAQFAYSCLTLAIVNDVMLIFVDYRFAFCSVVLFD